MQNWQRFLPFANVFNNMLFEPAFSKYIRLPAVSKLDKEFIELILRASFSNTLNDTDQVGIKCLLTIAKETKCCLSVSVQLRQ